MAGIQAGSSHISGTVDTYLQKDVALPLVYEVMEPNLIWPELLRQVPETTNAFMYQYDSAGKSGDSKKQTPPMRTGGAKFPRLDRSRRTVASGLLQQNGFEVAIPRAVIRNEQNGVSEIAEAYKTAGYWMAEWINTNVLAALVAGGTDLSTDFTPTAVWSAAGATPVDDLIRFASNMDREGYPFRLTDVFVNKAEWYELKAYLTSIDIDIMKQRASYGMPEITKDNIFVPVVDSNIHKVMSGMTDSRIIGIDAKNPAAEIHYYNDPEFSTVDVTYDTVIDSQPTSVTVPNLGIHFYQYEEDDSHDTIIQFWVENKTVVNKPFGIIYDTGI